MKLLIFILTTLFLGTLSAQDITGPQLLEKTIDYHDPNDLWGNLSATFYIDAETPDKPTRNRIVTLSNKEDLFRMHEKRGELETIRKMQHGECSFGLNGTSDIIDEDLKKYGLTCERTQMYKNYFTYLYGLPMKLKDKGTIVHEKVETVKFNEKRYLKLKVTYNPETGSDTWYFYFDPETFAMEAYQFYHDEAKNDGEYILLYELIDYEGFKIPKVRKWYMNNDDKFIGVDVLSKVEKN